MPDGDIKIYSGAGGDSGDFSSSIIENMREHRKNGNVDRAKALGAGLGGREFDLEKELPVKFRKPDIIYQAKVLLFFAAEANLQMLVFDPMLTAIAVNEMYETLQEREKGLYDNLYDGMAYSFYYSSVKNGGSLELEVGKTFAMLCSASDNESFIKTGAELYAKASCAVKKAVDEAGFRLI